MQQNNLNYELRDPKFVHQALLYCKTLLYCKFLTLFAALVGTIDAGVTRGGSRRFRIPPLKPEIYIKKKLVNHKIHCDNCSKMHFLSRPNGKILGGDAWMG